MWFLRETILDKFRCCQLLSVKIPSCNPDTTDMKFTGLTYRNLIHFLIKNVDPDIRDRFSNRHNFSGVVSHTFPPGNINSRFSRTIQIEKVTGAFCKELFLKHIRESLTAAYHAP